MLFTISSIFSNFLGNVQYRVNRYHIFLPCSEEVTKCKNQWIDQIW